MAKQTSVMQLYGMTALQKSIASSPDAVVADVGGVIATTTVAITQRAKALAPKRSGLLRSSIVGSARGLNGRVMIERAAFYWRFVEYGTVRMPARPFIRPATEAEAEPHEQRIRAVATKLERDFSAGSLL